MIRPASRYERPFPRRLSVQREGHVDRRVDALALLVVQHAMHRKKGWRLGPSNARSDGEPNRREPDRRRWHAASKVSDAAEKKECRGARRFSRHRLVIRWVRPYRQAVSRAWSRTGRSRSPNRQLQAVVVRFGDATAAAQSYIRLSKRHAGIDHDRRTGVLGHRRAVVRSSVGLLRCPYVGTVVAFIYITSLTSCLRSWCLHFLSYILHDARRAASLQPSPTLSNMLLTSQSACS